jgi:hypothetical protein
MTARRLLHAVIVAGSLGCHGVTSNPVGPHPTPVVVDTDLCDVAEANLKALHCPEGEPTKRGERFGDVCRELHAAGIFVNPRCLSTIASCSDVDVCTKTVTHN